MKKHRAKPKNTSAGLTARLWHAVQELGNRLGAGHAGDGMSDLGDGAALPRTGIGLSTLLGLLDWDHISAEVLRESRAQIVIAGAAGCGKTTLLNTLRGMDVHGRYQTHDERPFAAAGPEDLGLFALATVPESTEAMGLHDWLPIETANLNADLIVWLLDGEVGLRPWEYEWLCRVRATGRPLILALNKCDALNDPTDVARLSGQLAYPLHAVSARTGEGLIDSLLPAIVEVCPTLTTALGREVPAWRRTAVQHATQRAAMLSGLAGVEPVPLLDLPFQMLIQLRLVLRVAAAYGEPIGDRYSRELLATLVSGAGLRYAGQQLTKLVPVVGWVASGALAAAGTFAIGKLATTYFEHGRKWPKPQLHLPIPERLRKHKNKKNNKNNLEGL
jgi:uncharacterized protein (DUF697 family)